MNDWNDSKITGADLPPGDNAPPDREELFLEDALNDALEKSQDKDSEVALDEVLKKALDDPADSEEAPEEKEFPEVEDDSGGEEPGEEIAESELKEAAPAEEEDVSAEEVISKEDIDQMEIAQKENSKEKVSREENAARKLKLKAGKKTVKAQTSSFSTKKFFSGFLYGLTGLLVFLISLTGFSAAWVFKNWGDLDIDEIIYQIQMPLEGTGNGMIGDFILKALLPSVVILAIYIVVLILLKKGFRRILLSCAFLIATIVAGILIKNTVWSRLDMDIWLVGLTEDSVFIQDHYVNPKTVELTFPEKKRNIICIYLESMETTFADKASGGDFKKNVIPELTSLAKKNEDFSGSEDILDGGIVTTGTSFTSGALFGMTTGLPLKISIGSNAMDTQESFFPEIVGFGDILAAQGYRQIFLLGSDASFGGRRLYFEQHGGYEIRDYLYAKEHKWIPPDYFVFWGFEDEILFKNAKDTLTELAKEDRPFNLTILTVDTHFEDGYVCKYCNNQFGDDQYSNVMACSSKQVTNFISWIQRQDFYDNTTIVLTGDHTTMDTDYCEKVDPEYQRKTYTAIINPAVENQDPDRYRTYCTLDMFPTMLSAMGVSIDGNRLGLGTNLFSGVDTLAEEFGVQRVQQELAKKSTFLDRLEKIEDEQSGALVEYYRKFMQGAIVVENYDAKKEKLSVRIYESPALGVKVEGLELESQEQGKAKKNKTTPVPDPNIPGSYTCEVDISGWEKPVGELSLNMTIDNGNTYEGVASLLINYLLPDHSDFVSYFHELSQHPEYTVFLAVNDDASTGMTEEMQNALYELGLGTYLASAPQVSYYAVVDRGNIVENNGYEFLHYDGLLEGTDVIYTLESGGFYNGNTASITLNGVDYAPNTRGLNFVVYDSENGYVVDVGCFDVSPQTEIEEMPVVW